MEFNSISGTNHLLQPLAYNRVRKIILQGRKVRSAVEQFTIHTFARDFRSSLIYFPEPYEVDGPRSYTMQMIIDGDVVKPADYFKHPALFFELARFKEFMMRQHFWPFGYNIIKYKAVYILFDFSLFGTIERGLVKFPKIARRIPLAEAETAFQAWAGVPSMLFLQMDEPIDKELLEKIETYYGDI
jgi:hypothetical protein